MSVTAIILVVQQPFDGEAIEELTLSDWTAVDAMFVFATCWFANSSGWSRE